ncbi:hypothetical protein LCGC14_3109940 [marine sediment metagenome]|uniref:Uncharacterized protein n=1 Tax=marine sediment metagenome TaxID=412755 RepID=A0A0F8YVC1_9ZZZZ
MLNRYAIELVSSKVICGASIFSDIDIRLIADSFAFMDFWNIEHTEAVKQLIEETNIQIQYASKI